MRCSKYPLSDIGNHGLQHGRRLGVGSAHTRSSTARPEILHGIPHAGHSTMYCMVRGSQGEDRIGMRAIIGDLQSPIAGNSPRKNPQRIQQRSPPTSWTASWQQWGRKNHLPWIPGRWPHVNTSVAGPPTRARAIGAIRTTQRTSRPIGSTGQSLGVPSTGSR